MPAELLATLVTGTLAALGFAGKLVLAAILRERAEFVGTLTAIIADERAERLSMRTVAQAERDRWLAWLREEGEGLREHTIQSNAFYHMLSVDLAQVQTNREKLAAALEELTAAVRALNGKG